VSADAAHELLEHLSDGWSNPETYAAYVHLTADEGLQETAQAALMTALVVEHTLTPGAAGRLLKGLIERFLEDLDDAGLVDEYRALCDDLGSRWRIEWDEIAAAFLDDDRMTA
jgi:hypothetical protein